METSIKTEIDSTFGKLLKHYRINLGLSQAELSKKIGISDKYISRIEIGAGGISKETLIKYINILEISPNKLFKNFVTNSKIQKEIEISEKISELSEEKQKAILEIIKLLKWPISAGSFLAILAKKEPAPIGYIFNKFSALISSLSIVLRIFLDFFPLVFDACLTIDFS